MLNLASIFSGAIYSLMFCYLNYYYVHVFHFRFQDSKADYTLSSTDQRMSKEQMNAAKEMVSTNNHSLVVRQPGVPSPIVPGAR